jgi:hypothetical protein
VLLGQLFEGKSFNRSFSSIQAVIKNHGDTLRSWCEKWVVDPAGGWEEIVSKAEEVWIDLVVFFSQFKADSTVTVSDFMDRHSLARSVHKTQPAGQDGFFHVEYFTRRFL